MKIKRNIGDLDLDRLQEVLDYEPETGRLIWLKRLSPRCKLGEQAGCVKGGYRRIAIDGRSYTASHLAWLHFYGVEPEGLLDHKNLDKDDNRIDNLRPATYSQNKQNTARISSNTTGFKGVQRFYNPGNRARYRSTIRTPDGKRIFLGLFHTPEEAYKVYCKKAKELHGQFARVE